MTPFDDLFTKYSAISGVPRAVLEGIARTESSLRADIVTPEPNGHRSYGLFQILDTTAQGLGYDPQSLLDPETNIRAASDYIAGLAEQLGGWTALNLNDLYSLYNSGRADLWQTSDQVWGHVQNFLNNYALALQNSPAAINSAAMFLVAGLVLLWRHKR